MSVRGKFLCGADWRGFLLNRHFRQDVDPTPGRFSVRLIRMDQLPELWGLTCRLNFWLNINNSNLPVRCLNFGMSPCLQKRAASLWQGPQLSISLGSITYISSVTDEAWIHSVNSVQTWFILIVTLGLAVAPLQNGSPHEKIKAEALIWNLFVNSGLWDEDTPSACKCRPGEAWTSTLANSHPGTLSPPGCPLLLCSLWGNWR